MPGKSYNDQIEPGLFIQTTDIFDPQVIYELDIKSPQFKEFLVYLRQSVNNVAIALNAKNSGYYSIDEFVNGNLWFPNPTTASSANPQSSTLEYRQVFRTTVDFGALPNTASKSVAHNIPEIGAVFTFTHIYATASDTTAFSYIPIPYASTTGDDIELSVDATNVTIITLSNRTNYNQCYVVLEYIKD